ncbi:type 1 fimbrial protein [Morganella morganii]|uniref:fimbrial protein n=1 Tax=Morganella morganii TaxID=582 RepID=UPI000D1EA008|nr:fimbrial protein [Morganella morganii]HAE78494.1 type 1 fimbrial protein [Morganella sp. (in: enterobacteria)]QXO42375.1 type 1 fimbrial protein [Morganella morganii]QXO45999.1 type 1 fimbrial protein [Morganella morganii]QXO49680.1 type 1 fimbrial protein [Morganella morganii]QXO53538.1 type 1 fimbrial protein [Morganella morganii]
MNKKFALAASVSLIFVANSASAATTASGGSINFTGFITDATCTINNGNANMSVLLDPITVNQISGPGTIDEGKKAFSIELSDCNASDKDSKSLHINFASTNLISNNGNYMINQETDEKGNPKNVGIALTSQKTNEVINLNMPYDTKIAATGGAMQFYAKYYKVGSEPAQPGKINTMLTYNLSYF